MMAPDPTKSMKFVVVCRETGWRSKPFRSRGDAERNVEQIDGLGACKFPHEIEEVRPNARKPRHS